MGYIGTKPSAVPLTSADITDGIITSAKIADGTIVNADINASAAITSGKLSGVPAETQSSYTTTISYSTTLTSIVPTQTVTKTAYYTKNGNIVVVSFPYITTTNTFSSNSVLVFSFSLPFTSNANNRTIGNVFGYNLKGRYNTDVIAATQGAYFVSNVGGSSATADVGTYATAGGSGYIYLVDADGANLNLSVYYTI